jgi:hypothetical protein
MESAWIKERVVHMMLLLLLGLCVKVMLLLLLMVMVGKITGVCVHGWPRPV